MDIATQAQVVLREAGYETWPWTGASPPVICFENASLVGFVHVFESGAALAERWEASQQAVLARHAAMLRAAGAKAWNVYSVFLTGDASPERQRVVERLDEDFTLTRKIARLGVLTVEDVEHALMPLLPIKAQPVLEGAEIASRLRKRATDIPTEALTAFLGDVRAEDIVRILEGSQ